MNYNLVQREIKTLGEDLTELGKAIIIECPDTRPEKERALPRSDVTARVTPVPDVLAELVCVQQRLAALVNYIQREQ